MNRKIQVLLGCLAVSLASSAAAVMPGDDFNANTEAAVSALQRWYNGQGLWDSTGWWNAANCVEVLENAILAENGGQYLDILANTFELNCATNFINEYYDDEGWWANAWIRAYDLTGEVRYLRAAKILFNDMAEGWDAASCGGGLWWNKTRRYKNAIPNELFLLVAIRLHQRTPGDGGTNSYFYWATNEWAWFKASGMINPRNLINDGLTRDCRNNGRTTWTYNQGVIMGGLTELYKATGEMNYLAEAEAIADAAIANLVSANGVLQEPCETRRGCGGRDVPQFKGIFVRNLAGLYDVDRKASYYHFLFANAHAVWFHDRNAANQLGLKWTGPFDFADAARQSSAIMALSALAEPSTTLLPFAKGAGSPAFNHEVGAPAGTLAWICSPTIAGRSGLMQSGPFLSSLSAGNHVVHFRMAVDATSNSPASLVSLAVTRNGTDLAHCEVPWNSFADPGQFGDFQLPFTNTISGAPLEFRVFWNNAAGAPALTLNDVTIDGGHNWTAANLAHDVGRLNGLNAWEADPVRDRVSGFLVKGANTGELAEGPYTANFELKVDNFNRDNSIVATVSVVDLDANKVVVSRTLVRSEFHNVLYHTFALDFTAVAGCRYDFRTQWHFAPGAPRLTQRCLVVKRRSGDRIL